MTLAEYLPGVLAGEMPAAFEEEALRAQAVAARTFVLYHQVLGCAAHPEAAVCDDPSCCQVFLEEPALREKWGDGYDTYWARIQEAVTATDGEYLTYEGEPILACFHSSSAGRTENSGVLWGTSLPYLVSVDSPETAEDVPNYISTLEVSPEDFRDTILAALAGGGSEHAAAGVGGGIGSGLQRPRSRHPGGRAGGARYPDAHSLLPALHQFHPGMDRAELPFYRHGVRPWGRHEPIRRQRHGPGGEHLWGNPLPLLPRHRSDHAGIAPGRGYDPGMPPPGRREAGRPDAVCVRAVFPWGPAAPEVFAKRLGVHHAAGGIGQITTRPSSSRAWTVSPGCRAPSSSFSATASSTWVWIARRRGRAP